MKYEIKSSRESSVEHYGKRGLGWHGMAIIFYLLDNEQQPFKNIVYLDQLLNDTNLQDSGTVIGLLEVGIRVRLKGILECNLKGKPRKIYEEFNMSYGGLYPKDLPMKQIQMNQMIPRLNRLSKGSKGTLSRK